MSNVSEQVGTKIREVLPILEPLARQGVYRTPIYKYCLVVYPPRNSVETMQESGMAGIADKISALPDGSPIDLYVHVPYCSRACTFCNFYFVPGLDEFSHRSELYTNCIQRESEILGKLTSGRLTISSLYLGGGSPSLLRPEQINKILRSIEANVGSVSDIEVSLELHPEVVRLQNKDYLERLREVGITRISVGMQSSNPDILKMTRRGHTAEEAYKLLESTRRLAFVRNVDLMWGFVNQRQEDHQRTLDSVIATQPDTVTTYFLEIRPKSPDFENYIKATSDAEYQKRVIEMGILNRTVLENSDFEERTFDYWFSGRDFEHRKRKWGGDDTVLLSLGPGTYNWIFHGEDKNIVFFKPYDTYRWAQDLWRGEYTADRSIVLGQEETKRRHAMFSLRQGKISERKVEDVQELQQTAQALVDKGLATYSNGVFELTLPGKLLNHEIATLFSSDRMLEASSSRLTPDELKYASFTHPEILRRFKNVLREK